MKKRTMAALAMLGASMAMGSVPQLLPQEQQNKVTKTNEAVEKIPQTVRQGKRTAINPTGGVEFINYTQSRSPKEYGQWLQYNRKQKWSK